MTTPSGDSPAGSLAVGAFAAWRAQTESDAKLSIRGVPMNAWSAAQTNMHSEFTRNEFTHREVTRLDNRIDELMTTGASRAQLATFSSAAWWHKPAGTYRIVADVLGGSSGGGRSNDGGSGGPNRVGAGGWSGAWQRFEIEAHDVPNSVWVTVGAGGAGATSDGGNGGAGGDSTFGALITALGASPTAYGIGNFSFRIRGGDGDAQGGAGTYDPGGMPPSGFSGSPGENGYSVVAGKVGMGSGAGGGSSRASPGNGGKGGDGGWPSGPGGGGGAYSSFGFAGNGGNGAGAAVFITSYYRDTLGVAPSAPSGIHATGVGSTLATLNWTASTDDVRVDVYEVTLGSVLLGSTAGTSFHLSDLSPSTTYGVSIVAVDIGGNRSVAGTGSFTTTTA